MWLQVGSKLAPSWLKLASRWFWTPFQNPQIMASGASKKNFDIWPVVFMKGCKCIGCDTMRSCPLPIIAIFQIMSGVWSNILSVMEYLYSQTVPSWSNMPRAGGLANAFRAFLYGQPWGLSLIQTIKLCNQWQLHTSISCICVDHIRDPLSESLDLCCSSSKYVFLFL